MADSQERLDCGTESLQALLRQDAASDEPGMDAAGILQITKALAAHGDGNQFPDVNAAWDSFCRNYQPADKDSASLFDLDSPPPKARRPLFRAFAVAAALAATLLAVTLTASALGYDLLGAVAAWGHETFQFVSISGAPSEKAVTSPAAVPAALQALSDSMTENGMAAASLLPGFFPEGYVQAELQSFCESEISDFYCRLEQGEDAITLLYHASASGNGSIFEKDAGDPEVYAANGRTFYIMTNADSYVAVWMDANVECSIFGVRDHETLLKILDSVGLCAD